MNNTNLTFTYKNWKGKTRIRNVEPVSITLKSTEYHKEVQWILKAIDTEINEIREFAMKDIVGIE